MKSVLSISIVCLLCISEGMRSLLLLLGLTTVCVSGQKLDLSKELSISNKTLALFKKELSDIDLVQRYLKLSNLDSRSKVAKLTKEQEKELKERRAKIPNTVIQKPPGVTATDLSEINEQSGIANFLYEGDINLTEEQLNELTKSVAGDSNVSGVRVKRGGSLNSAPMWPNGIVYYYLDKGIATNFMKLDAIMTALHFLEAKTCISFFPSRYSPNRIKVIEGNGCYSAFGMIGNEQILSIGNGCEAIGTVAHEFTHALGFDHMQSRYDRDLHITVDYSKIMTNHTHNFDKLTINNSINYTPYEYGGMMQYSAMSFSTTPNIKNSSSFTMIPTGNNTNYLHTMGNKMITFYDAEGINLKYNCSANCPVATSAKCQNGGVPNPNNCTTCNCPLGYAGALCDQMPPVFRGCGGELNATSAWQPKSFRFGVNTLIVRHQFTECHHWIKAPTGSKIQVRITNMTNPLCNYGCQYNGIEFKLKNQRMTNPKICCVEFLQVLHTAELNPLPVIAHNRIAITEFTIEYRIGILGELGDIDLVQRYQKLGNLASHSKVAKLTKEQDKELKERLSKIKNTVIKKPPGVNANDLFEINEKSGIANFLYEGDINLTEEQLDELTKSVAGDSSVSGARVKRGAASRTARKWPNGIVYYYFDTNITQNQMKVDAIKAAFKFFQAKTCIRFLYSQDNRDRIKVTDGNGVYSDVGMTGKEQILSLGDNIVAMGNAAHEFTHALGFQHMQNRFHRDQYITVDANKMRPNKMINFKKLTKKNSINYTPYEYGGFMQYTGNSFSGTPNIKNSSSLTMIPTDINYVHTMGSRMISFYDVKGLNDHYNCSANCPVATSAKCQNGGVPNPNNCTICNCPLGYAGDLCDQMPPASGGCGGELNATSAWQAKSFKYGENTAILRHQYTECHHWIKAPAGSKIQVRITNMTNAVCDYGCQYNGIEFKLKDQRMTNPKICCREFLNDLHTAELNPVPVIAHNRYGITEFTIEYRIDQGVTLPATTPCPPEQKKKNKCCCSIL